MYIIICRVLTLLCGLGIAIEDQCKMFKQFTQFNRNLLQGGGGSGLGLWICKNLASFHGGRMVGTSTCSSLYPSLSCTCACACAITGVPIRRTGEG